MKTFRGWFFIFVLVGCSTAITKKPIEELASQEEFNKYELILYWNDSNKQSKYEMYLSAGFPTAKEVYGMWMFSQEKALSVALLKSDPLTLILQIPLSHTNWLLRIKDHGESKISGIFFVQKSWSTINEVGSFEIIWQKNAPKLGSYRGSSVRPAEV